MKKHSFFAKLLVLAVAFAPQILSAKIVSPGYFAGDGASRYVEIPQSNDFTVAANGTFSIACKVYFETKADYTIFSNRSGSPLKGYRMYVTAQNGNYPNGTISVSVNNNGGTSKHVNDDRWNKTYPSVKAWHTFVWVYNSSQMTLWIDGEKIDTEATTDGFSSQTIPAQDLFLIGADKQENTVKRFLNGKIQSVYIYRNALTDDQVKAESTAQTFNASANVIAAYDFKDFTGGKVKDISNNGHDGVLKGDWSEYDDTPRPTPLHLFGDGVVSWDEYRIPALIQAADGSLIAVADNRYSHGGDLPNNISIMARRSTDGGKNWGNAQYITRVTTDGGSDPTYGDAAIVMDKVHNPGRLILVFCGKTGFWQSRRNGTRQQICMKYSDDNGVSWSPTKEITAHFDQKTSIQGAFLASGRGVQLKDGRIGFVANSHESTTDSESIEDYFLFTDDGGETWQISTDGPMKYSYNTRNKERGNESKVIELENGWLMMSIRNWLDNSLNPNTNRLFSISKDRGQTWSKYTVSPDIYDDGCNGDILRYPSFDGQTRILQSVPSNKSSRRQDVTMYLSKNEGGAKENFPAGSWLKGNVIQSGPASYSSFEILNDGTIAALIENEGTKCLYYYTFSLDWLTDGADTYSAKFRSVTVDPKTANGKVKLQISGRDLLPGEVVECGSEITVVPEANEGFECESVALKNSSETLSLIGGGATFRVEETQPLNLLVFTATFKEKEDPTALTSAKSESAQAEFFTLSGARVSENALQRGTFYLKKSGSKVEKIFID